MPNIITLTRTRSRFSNVDDGFMVGAFPREYPGEPLADVERYILPDGFEVGESGAGALEVYQTGTNRHCPIVMHSSGRPQLLADFGNAPVLALAPQ